MKHQQYAIYYRSTGTYTGPHTCTDGATVDGITFDARGESAGGTAELRDFTPEIADRIEAQEITRRLKAYVDWRQLPVAALREIAQLAGLK